MATPAFTVERRANTVLPRLRDDLQVIRGGASYSGAPTWVILDPLRNRFFSVTFEMFQLLSLWNKSLTPRDLKMSVRREFGRDPPQAEVDATIRILTNNFFIAAPPGGWVEIQTRARQGKSWLSKLTHNYLFFKIPLVRPEPFLAATWPFVSFLFTRSFLIISGIVALIGLYLASRQWESFVGTFPYLFSLEGLAVSIVSLVLIKSLHELGHGYSAHRNGCHTATMGVAFLLLVPLLYTDVTDAWRLKSRRARIEIDSAGVLVELCVAAFALFAWAFLPEGPVRSAVFVLATTSWMLSLLINLNPFTRFDGYYMLADAVGIENLQMRGFAHLRWRLRRLLFGLKEAPYDSFPPRLDAFVTAYAAITLIYRLILYIGIALLVYHYTVKIIGVLLFAAEVWLLIARPVWNELKVWSAKRGEIMRSSRTYLSLLILAGGVGLLFLPLSTTVRAPALLMPQDFARVFSVESGQVQSRHVVANQEVKYGDTLFVLSAPALLSEKRVVQSQIDLTERRLARIGASPGELAARGVFESERHMLLARLRGLTEREEKLTLRAPADGRVLDLNAEISIGRWVSRHEKLALIAAPGGTVARGYLSAGDQARLAKGAQGSFIPDDLTWPKFAITLMSIASAAADRIETPQLTSNFGGPIAVVADPDGGLVPNEAQHALVAALDTPPNDLLQAVPGVLVIEGQAQSVAAGVWRQVLRVLIREAGT